MANAATTPDDTLSPIPLYVPEGCVPPELQESVQRHQRHLAALVESLRAAGLGDEVIEESVGQLLESYRQELTAAMRALMLEKSRV